MRIQLLLAAAVLVPGVFAIEQSRLPRHKLVNAEKLVDAQLAKLYPGEPYFLIGFSRSLYLEGYGLVFTAEINLAQGPPQTPFNPQPITPAVIARHHDEKMSRVPKLKNAMYGVLESTVSLLPELKDDDRIVVGITLMKYPWERTDGIPAQIIMQATRAQILDAQRKRAKLDTLVTVHEQ